jgi:hypothetical protein
MWTLQYDPDGSLERSLKVVTEGGLVEKMDKLWQSVKLASRRRNAPKKADFEPVTPMKIHGNSQTLFMLCGGILICAFAGFLLENVVRIGKFVWKILTLCGSNMLYIGIAIFYNNNNNNNKVYFSITDT